MSNTHSSSQHKSKYRLLVKSPPVSQDSKTSPIYYSLSTEDNMATDVAPLINSQDSNFDEDDYLSESNRKTYGMYSSNGECEAKSENMLWQVLVVFMWKLAAFLFKV